MSTKKSISSVVRSMSDLSIAKAARMLEDKDLATAIRRGSNALHEKLLPCVLGEALSLGEIVVADGPDLPKKLRAANKKRLAKLPKVERDKLQVTNVARLAS